MGRNVDSFCCVERFAKLFEMVAVNERWRMVLLFEGCTNSDTEPARGDMESRYVSET
jgi:hypothetical protein